MKLTSPTTMKPRIRKRRRRRTQRGGVIGTLAATLIPMVIDQATSLAMGKGPPKPIWSIKYPQLWKKKKEGMKKPDKRACRSLRYSVWNPACRKKR